MPNHLGSKKVAVSALIALGAVGGSVAYAYPPGTSMNVGAIVTAHPSSADVVVTVTNANPECRITISVEGAPDRVINPGHAETITETITTGFHGGQHKIKVKGTACSAKEKSQTVYDITNQRVETNSSRYELGDTMKVKAFNFTPNSDMTFRFYYSGMPAFEVPPVTVAANKQGNANTSFKIKGTYPPGNWTLVVYTGSVTESHTIVVDDV